MPKFFFNVRAHGSFDPDPEGSDFPSIDEAYEEAVAAARELLAEKVAAGEVIDGNQFEITDEEGVIVRIVPFRSVLRLD